MSKERNTPPLFNEFSGTLTSEIHEGSIIVAGLYTARGGHATGFEQMRAALQKCASQRGSSRCFCIVSA